MPDRLGLVALKEHAFDNEKPIPPEKPTIFDLVETVDGEEEIYPLLTVGGVLSLIGKTGTAKSTILSIIHTAFFCESKQYLNVRCNDEGSMLWVDTEMSESSDFMYFQKNMHKRLGVEQNIPMYKGISLKYLPTGMERYNTLVDILQSSNNDKEEDYFGNLRVVVLDGFADILTDTNNEEQAKDRIKYLSSLADARGIGIVTVLHTDKMGLNARGFAGSMLEIESQVMMKTSRYSNNDPFKVECEKMRSKKPFHPFRFTFEEDGIGLRIVDDSESIDLSYMSVSNESIEKEDKKYKLI